MRDAVNTSLYLRTILVLRPFFLCSLHMSKTTGVKGYIQHAHYFIEIHNSLFLAVSLCLSLSLHSMTITKHGMDGGK